MKKVLIIYGTRFGTTQNTSEKIRVFLETKEIEVSINIEDKESFLSGFDGVLIGTGIKMSMWTKKIKKVISQGNVKIIKGDNITFAEKATYFGLDGKLVLEGNPRLIYFPESKK